MNPTLSVTVDSRRKASCTGIVCVGEKVDVSVTVPSVSAGDGLRFRIVDDCGRDLVRYPAKASDTWSLTSGTFSATVDFNTAQLRMAMCGIPYSGKATLGVIVDSALDSAQYATGRVTMNQWAAASTEDPTVLPDWREVLADLNAALASVDSSKAAAQAAAASAASSSSSAAASASDASASKSSASASASLASEERTLAQAARSASEAAKLSAEVAVSHYPKIGANGNWFVWDAARGGYADTRYPANGGHDIFGGKVFARPTTARGWYDLVAYLVREMGGNIDMQGITPGSAPSSITMTASDGVSKSLRIVTSGGEYTTEVL